MNRWIYVMIAAVILLALFLYFYVRKAYAIQKVCAMPLQDKLDRIDQIDSPFGFRYKLAQDLFTSETDAWQKECGYCSSYDQYAPFFHMIFDCEPVYFDYQDKTWLIELWKGQYGITAGCEIGIYHADRLIPKNERKRTLFGSVSPEEMPVFSVTLLKDNSPLTRQCERHWWLTGFCIGRYIPPESLAMKTAIVFSSQEMCQSFLHGLEEAGYSSREIYVNGSAVSFTFSEPRFAQPRLRQTWYGKWVLFKNRMLLHLYVKITEPFYFTADRLLLLYEYLPLLFRYILKIRRYKKRKWRR